jgi:ABC-2 type transport system ATP-binding protein
MSTAIEIEGLRYRASPEFAIEDLSLQVPSGALYGFLGPNGCGKTTSIRLMLGLLRPQAGSVRLLDHKIPSELPAALRRTGVIPDRPHLHGYLSIADALAFHAAFYPPWDARWAADLLEEFRLRPGQRVSRLSKGETAKLMMLLALCQKPDLLVLDEPMDGLDPVVRRDVLAALLDYVSAHGATVFVSSHLVHELERFCDWIGVMDRGKLVVELPMEEFRSGNKRIRVSGNTRPESFATAPFTVLTREREAGDLESLVVRGWRPDMKEWFARDGIALREIADLDLEDGFVELLRGFRAREA